MNKFLIPANANRGKLILGFFRLIDLFIFLGGVGATFILLLAFQYQLSELPITVLVLSPACVAGFLVMPIPYQHNMRVFIVIVYRFFSSRRRYWWKGWCEPHGEEDTK